MLFFKEKEYMDSVNLVLDISMNFFFTLEEP